VKSHRVIRLWDQGKERIICRWPSWKIDNAILVIHYEQGSTEEEYALYHLHIYSCFYRLVVE
jgi:hypothetical protein